MIEKIFKQKGEIMKKIEIKIREINLDEDFTPIEDKIVTSVHMFHDDEKNLEDILSYVLDDRWTILKSFYLRKRKSLPFRKIRSRYEEISTN